MSARSEGFPHQLRTDDPRPPAWGPRESEAGAEADFTDLQQRLLAVVLEKGYEHRDEPFQLSSGQPSHDYIDGKRALASGDDLLLAARCIIALAKAKGVDFDAIGGLTMGADAIAHAVALVSGKRWFSVRKEAKRHGKQKLIEGAELASGDEVLVVDDVVTTAGSIGQALDAIDAIGARVVLAVTIIDRGDKSRERLAARGVPYEPVLTYEDLGIEAVHG